MCGVAGGVIAWVATDAAIITLDEYFNRDEFEAELRALIDEDKAQSRAALTEMVAGWAASMEAQSDAVADFTLRELNAGAVRR